MGGMFVFDLGW